MKARLSASYLGKAGIHAIGARPSDNAVTVYMSPEGHPEREEMIARIKREAVPYDVISIEEAPPRMS